MYIKDHKVGRLRVVVVVVVAASFYFSNNETIMCAIALYLGTCCVYTYIADGGGMNEKIQ